MHKDWINSLDRVLFYFSLFFTISHSLCEAKLGVWLGVRVVCFKSKPVINLSLVLTLRPAQFLSGKGTKLYHSAGIKALKRHLRRLLRQCRTREQR